MTRPIAAAGAVSALLTAATMSGLAGADPAPGGGGATQIGACSATTLSPGAASEIRKLSPDLLQAWRFSLGEGQTVAVIDTGVRPSQRLRVEPGGDYVQSTDGLTDCDGHGTSVAGIIGAQPGEDGFSGIAPKARLVSIRQSSSKFSRRAEVEDAARGGPASAVRALAQAITRAADLGASVIDVSVTTCLSAAQPVDQTALGDAVRRAAVDKDAVIVAAAGDIDGSEQRCRANPLSGSGDDPRNWSGAESISVPSSWQPFVLSVGSVSPTGAASSFTMPGPWVGLAGPGERVTSLSNRTDGGLADARTGQDGTPVALSGTGYAAAYVSGVAALVRSRFPELSSGQVIARLRRTARGASRSPSNLVGAGVADPVAALTWEVGPDDGGEAGGRTRAVVPPPAPAPENPLPRRLAFAGAGACLAAALAAAALARRGARGKGGAE